VQGAAAALTGPCALALIVRTFTDPGERTRALGITVMASGIGSAGGLLVGGLLTEAASWRWVLFVNVPTSPCSPCCRLWR
jgi:MFS family permease